MMHRESIPRRAFLIDAARIAAAGWLSVELELLASCAPGDGGRDSGFTHLGDAQVRALLAFAAQLIPSVDGAPGAHELGAAHFVDRALAIPFFASSAQIVRDGLADIDARARATYGRPDFASAHDLEQIAIMRAVETTPFFSSARTLVIMGAFADPAYGGNRNAAGWSLLGLEHRGSFSAPFGWYDAHLASTPPTAAA